MTLNEARIARIAYTLGLSQGGPRDGPTPDLDEMFIKMYKPDRPCHYEVECVRDGRCPNDPVCNN